MFVITRGIWKSDWPSISHSKEFEFAPVVCLLAIAALACSIVGCTSPVRLTAEEARKALPHNYTALVKPSAIVGVVRQPVSDSALRLDVMPKSDSAGQHVDKRSITFDSLGGTLDTSRGRIFGKDTSGIEVSLALGELRFVRFERSNGRKSFMPANLVIPSLDRGWKNPDKRINPGATPCWDRIDMSGNGARLDAETGTITGTTTRGRQMSVGLGEVLYLQYERRDWIKTARRVTMLAAFIAIGLGTYSVYTM
jgi:hypothetical protein